MKKNKTFQLRLSESHLKTLRELAEQQDLTVSAIIRKMIDESKEKNSK